MLFEILQYRLKPRPGYHLVLSVALSMKMLYSFVFALMAQVYPTLSHIYLYMIFSDLMWGAIHGLEFCKFIVVNLSKFYIWSRPAYFVIPQIKSWNLEHLSLLRDEIHILLCFQSGSINQVPTNYATCLYFCIHSFHTSDYILCLLQQQFMLNQGTIDSLCSNIQTRNHVTNQGFPSWWHYQTQQTSTMEIFSED